MASAHTSDDMAITCWEIGTYCQGYFIFSNLPVHTNDDTIKSCTIEIRECFMSLTMWLNINH